MQQLHAYWRMEYIEAPRYPAAMKRPFTELPALGNDRAALIIHRSRLSYLILNRFPYNPGHLLAVPFRDVTALTDLAPEERADLFEEVVVGQELLTAALHPDGFNIGFNLGSAVAGGSIAHLHAHIVPRWNGDNNFMPVIGRTRILPQSLDATWAKLAAAADRYRKANAKSGKPETAVRIDKALGRNSAGGTQNAGDPSPNAKDGGPRHAARDRKTASRNQTPVAVGNDSSGDSPRRTSSRKTAAASKSTQRRS